MEVTVNIPDEIAGQLLAQGSDLSRLALEALAVEGYRAETLSLGQVAEMLNLTTYEADGFLKERGVLLNYSLEEFESENAGLAALLSN